jgi:dephospho-CoA kinase
MDRFLRVGLTGGIGSGKSEVARRFAQWGAIVIDADALARAALGPGTPGLAAVAARWPHVIDARGILDRTALAQIVFADAAARDALNAIVHPIVRAGAAAIEGAAVPGTIVVHDVPLLFEGDYWEECDRTVVVVAPRIARIARVRARDGRSEAEIEARMAAQIDPQIARARAGEVIENDGDLATLDARAHAVFERLLAAANV